MELKSSEHMGETRAQPVLRDTETSCLSPPGLVKLRIQFWISKETGDWEVEMSSKLILYKYRVLQGDPWKDWEQSSPEGTGINAGLSHPSLEQRKHLISGGPRPAPPLPSSLQDGGPDWSVKPGGGGENFNLGR